MEADSRPKWERPWNRKQRLKADSMFSLIRGDFREKATICGLPSNDERHGEKRNYQSDTLTSITLGENSKQSCKSQETNFKSAHSSLLRYHQVSLRLAVDCGLANSHLIVPKVSASSRAQIDTFKRPPSGRASSRGTLMQSLLLLLSLAITGASPALVEALNWMQSDPRPTIYSGQVSFGLLLSAHSSLGSELSSSSSGQVFTRTLPSEGWQETSNASSTSGRPTGTPLSWSTAPATTSTSVRRDRRQIFERVQGKRRPPASSRGHAHRHRQAPPASGRASGGGATGSGNEERRARFEPPAGACGQTNPAALYAGMGAIWASHQANLVGDSGLAVGVYVYDSCNNLDIGQRQSVRIVSNLNAFQQTTCEAPRGSPISLTIAHGDNQLRAIQLLTSFRVPVISTKEHFAFEDYGQLTRDQRRFLFTTAPSSRHMAFGALRFATRLVARAASSPKLPNSAHKSSSKNGLVVISRNLPTRFISYLAEMIPGHVNYEMLQSSQPIEQVSSVAALEAVLLHASSGGGASSAGSSGSTSASTSGSSSPTPAASTPTARAINPAAPTTEPSNDDQETSATQGASDATGSGDHEPLELDDLLDRSEESNEKNNSPRKIQARKRRRRRFLTGSEDDDDSKSSTSGDGETSSSGDQDEGAETENSSKMLSPALLMFITPSEAIDLVTRLRNDLAEVSKYYSLIVATREDISPALQTIFHRGGSRLCSGKAFYTISPKPDDISEFSRYFRDTVQMEGESSDHPLICEFAKHQATSKVHADLDDVSAEPVIKAVWAAAAAFKIVHRRECSALGGGSRGSPQESSTGESGPSVTPNSATGESTGELSPTSAIGKRVSGRQLAASSATVGSSQTGSRSAHAECMVKMNKNMSNLVQKALRRLDVFVNSTGLQSLDGFQIKFDEANELLTNKFSIKYINKECEITELGQYSGLSSSLMLDEVTLKKSFESTLPEPWPVTTPAPQVTAAEATPSTGSGSSGDSGSSSTASSGAEPGSESAKGGAGSSSSSSSRPNSASDDEESGSEAPASRRQPSKRSRLTQGSGAERTGAPSSRVETKRARGGVPGSGVAPSPVTALAGRGLLPGVTDAELASEGPTPELAGPKQRRLKSFPMLGGVPLAGWSPSGFASGSGSGAEPSTSSEPPPAGYMPNGHQRPSMAPESPELAGVSVSKRERPLEERRVREEPREAPESSLVSRTPATQPTDPPGLLSTLPESAGNADLEVPPKRTTGGGGVAARGARLLLSQAGARGQANSASASTIVTTTTTTTATSANSELAGPAGASTPTTTPISVTTTADTPTRGRGQTTMGGRQARIELAESTGDYATASSISKQTFERPEVRAGSSTMAPTTTPTDYRASQSNKQQQQQRSALVADINSLGLGYLRDLNSLPVPLLDTLEQTRRLESQESQNQRHNQNQNKNNRSKLSSHYKWINGSWPALAILGANICGAILTLYVLTFLLMRNCDGSLERENQAIRSMYLLAIIVLFFGSTLFIVYPTPGLCLLRSSWHNFALVMLFGSLLLQSMQIRSLSSLGLGGRPNRLNQFITLLFVIGVQVSFELQRLKYESTNYLNFVNQYFAGASSTTALGGDQEARRLAGALASSIASHFSPLNSINSQEAPVSIQVSEQYQSLLQDHCIQQVEDYIQSQIYLLILVSLLVLLNISNRRNRRHLTASGVTSGSAGSRGKSLMSSTTTVASTSGKLLASQHEANLDITPSHFENSSPFSTSVAGQAGGCGSASSLSSGNVFLVSVICVPIYLTTVILHFNGQMSANQDLISSVSMVSMAFVALIGIFLPILLQIHRYDGYISASRMPTGSLAAAAAAAAIATGTGSRHLGGKSRRHSAQLQSSRPRPGNCGANQLPTPGSASAFAMFPEFASTGLRRPSSASGDSSSGAGSRRPFAETKESRRNMSVVLANLAEPSADSLRSMGLNFDCRSATVDRGMGREAQSSAALLKLNASANNETEALADDICCAAAAAAAAEANPALDSNSIQISQHRKLHKQTPGANGERRLIMLDVDPCCPKHGTAAWGRGSGSDQNPQTSRVANRTKNPISHNNHHHHHL